jgi:hypothetical protein
MNDRKEKQKDKEKYNLLEQKFNDMDPTERSDLFQVVPLRKILKHIRPNSTTPSRMIGYHLDSTKPLNAGEYAYLYFIYLKKKRWRQAKTN